MLGIWNCSQVGFNPSSAGPLIYLNTFATSTLACSERAASPAEMDVIALLPAQAIPMLPFEVCTGKQLFSTPRGLAVGCTLLVALSVNVGVRKPAAQANYACAVMLAVGSSSSSNC